MKTNFLLLILLAPLFIFSQFPGERTKKSQVGPDNFVYNTGDLIQLGKALNGKSFRNVFVYLHKDILDNLDDALNINILPSSKIYEDKDNNMIIAGSDITGLPNTFNNFKGKIKYFKVVKTENNYFSFAILKVPNSKLRIAVPLQSAILTGELISNNKKFSHFELEENSNIDELKIKSFDNGFDIKLVSVKGNKNSQTVTISFLISHNYVHQEVIIYTSHKYMKAYDFDGNEYNISDDESYDKHRVTLGSKENRSYAKFEFSKGGYGVKNKIPTKVPVKCTLILERVKPEVEKFSFVSVKVGFTDYGKDLNYRNGKFNELEFQNLDIDWEN